MFTSKKDLKKWLEDYLVDKGKKSLHTAINNSKAIKDSIFQYTSFLPNNTRYNQRCYHIINNINDIPLCKECAVNKVNFNNRNKEWRYLDFCSHKCGKINKSVIEKYKSTNILLYGVDNFAKTDRYKKNMIIHNNKKYGVDWYLQSEEYHKKSIITCLHKYGVDNYTKTDEFKNRVRCVCLEKYGVDWYSKSQEFKNKYKESSLIKYGVVHPMLNIDFKQNVSSSIENKYGEKWYVMTDKFKEESFTKKNLKYGHPISGFKYKDYQLPSGNIVKIQGYEGFALDILFMNYEEEDVMISYQDIKEEIGILNYLMDEQNKIYLPDIYIKSENKIIEVKSLYTYNLELEKNILKKEVCIQIGLCFEFWIFDKKGNIVEIPT